MLEVVYVWTKGWDENLMKTDEMIREPKIITFVSLVSSWELKCHINLVLQNQLIFGLHLVNFMSNVVSVVVVWFLRHQHFYSQRWRIFVQELLYWCVNQNRRLKLFNIQILHISIIQNVKGKKRAFKVFFSYFYVRTHWTFKAFVDSENKILIVK